MLAGPKAWNLIRFVDIKISRTCRMLELRWAEGLWLRKVAK